MSSITIDIPIIVAREITPNASRRVPQGMKTRLKQELRDTARYAALEAGLQDAALHPPLVMDITRMMQKGARPMDDDNFTSFFKWGRDQIAAVAGVDDKHITTGEVRQEKSSDGIGRILVTIRELEGREQ